MKILKPYLYFVILTFIACNVNSHHKASLEKDINSKNRVVIIDQEIDLEGDTLFLYDSIVFLNSGKIKNGVLFGNFSRIVADHSRQIFKEVIFIGTWSNEVAYLNWLVDGFDSVENLRSLRQVVRLANKIVVNAIYELSGFDDNPIRLNGPIEIRGSEKDAGFLFLVNRPVSVNVFTSADDIDLILRNIQMHLSAASTPGSQVILYEQVYEGFSDEEEYVQNSLVVEGCEIVGNIGIKYFFLNKKKGPISIDHITIDSILLRNNRFFRPGTFLQCSNVNYRYVQINDNTINDLSGPLFFFPISGLDYSISEDLINYGRDYLSFVDNVVDGTNSTMPENISYLSPLVAKGRSFLVKGNSISNILCYDSGVETVPFYCSASEKLEIYENVIVNVAGRNLAYATNTLLKLKGTRKCIARDNHFELNKEALVLLDVIQDHAQDLKSIDSSTFRFCLWGADINRSVDTTSYYHIKRNSFHATYINDYSLLSKHVSEIDSNEFKIEYVGNSDLDKWGGEMRTMTSTIFYLRDSMIDGEVYFRDNRIAIEGSSSPLIFFTRDFNDNKVLRHVEYSGNSFVGNTSFSLAYPRTDFLKSVNYLEGEGSLVYNSANTNKRNRSIKQQELVQIVSDYRASSTAPSHIKNFGTNKIIAESNGSDIANVIEFTFNDLYFYNEEDQFPIQIDVTITTSQQFEAIYRMIVDENGTLVFFSENGQYKEGIQPYRNEHYSFNIMPYKVTAPDAGIRLEMFSDIQSGRRRTPGYLRFTGLSRSRGFTIISSIKPVSRTLRSNGYRDLLLGRG